MLYQLDHNTYFYDAREDINYEKIEVYMRTDKTKRSSFFVSLKDKNILRKYKIDSFLNKDTTLKDNIDLIIYRNDENYYYCKNLFEIDLIDSKELLLKFKLVKSSTHTQSLNFLTTHIIKHKDFFIKQLNCENILELVKRFR